LKEENDEERNRSADKIAELERKEDEYVAKIRVLERDVSALGQELASAE
jgi:hypothetical protein